MKTQPSWIYNGPTRESLSDNAILSVGGYVLTPYPKEEIAQLRADNLQIVEDACIALEALKGVRATRVFLGILVEDQVSGAIARLENRIRQAVESLRVKT